MPETSFVKSAIFAAVLVIISIICWELYLRNKGFETSYNDDPSLWTDKRDMAYESSDKATVFIGSSRIKFDLDIATWESITGNHAIQLACVGSNPVPVLENLAADDNFKGRLVVDVTEGLFFSKGADFRPRENMKFYKERTPSQRASFYINHLLESQFVFLDKERLSMGAMMDKLPFENRQGVYFFGGFPPDFGRVKFNRQEYMTDKFSSDTTLQNIVKNIWVACIKASKAPPPDGATVDSMIAAVKISVDKIQARGGQVFFVRTPSSGGAKIGETMVFPREKYWNKLLAVTGCPGLHYSDYPAIDHFICPENSHLSLTDAKTFTINFIKILSEEKGWKFPKPIAL
jgi:hypothetical protein